MCLKNSKTQKKKNKSPKENNASYLFKFGSRKIASLIWHKGESGNKFCFFRRPRNSNENSRRDFYPEAKISKKSAMAADRNSRFTSKDHHN